MEILFFKAPRMFTGFHNTVVLYDSQNCTAGKRCSVRDGNMVSSFQRFSQLFDSDYVAGCSIC